MRFHLIYHGQLSPSGNKPKPAEAARIRSELSGQIENLWSTHNSLQVLRQEAAVLAPGARDQNINVAGKWLTPREKADRGIYVDLIPEMEVKGRHFLPLVRKSLALNCEIDILFLRQQNPGDLVTQAGDIDNRVKTVLDALTLPKPENEERHPTPGEGLVHCLMESDTLVSRLNIDTDRLLFPSTGEAKEAHLVIEVSLNVLRVGAHNMCLL